MSFAEAVQGLKANGENKLKFIPISVNELAKSFVDLDPVIEEGSKLWNRTLVGYFVSMQLSYREIMGHLKRMWRDYNLEDIIVNECGLYFLKFNAEEGMQVVLENGPWLVDGKPLFIQK